jgi:hypothetical protein
MTRQYKALLDELVYHVKTLAWEAQAGDEGAWQWCVEAFPGHVDFFLALWDATPEAGQVKKCRTQWHGRAEASGATTTATGG